MGGAIQGFDGSAYRDVAVDDEGKVKIGTPGTDASDLGKAEDAAHTSGDVGVMLLAVRKNTAAALAADGDYIPLIVDGTGRLYIAAAPANDGVDIGNVDVASIVPGVAATNLGKAEDNAHASGDVGVMALAVRSDTAAAKGADNDYHPLLVDANGRLHITGPIYSAPSPQTPTSYRAAVTAADVLAVPGTVTCTKQAGGSCDAGTHNVKVVAGNAYGRTTATAGNTAVTTETTNLTVRAAFAQVTGATFYDIYCSTDSDPKWVGRITEAQRAAGCAITGVGVVGAGGTAGAVDIQEVGTGLQAATTAAVNTAYNVPAGVDCTGYTYCDFDILPSRTGGLVSLAVTVIPFFYNSRTSSWRAGKVETLTFGGTLGMYDPLTKTLRVEARGRTVALVVAAIAGTGASIDIDAVLS